MPIPLVKKQKTMEILDPFWPNLTTKTIRGLLARIVKTSQPEDIHKLYV